MSVRVRFAPSPTGNLHIGSARTALFNWLYARNQNGKFILRIEDTDKTRSKQEYLDNIVEGLKWLGLDWDEQLSFQSERQDIYRSYAEKLLREGNAYYCDSDPLEGVKATTKPIKFKIPKNKVVINDIVHGKIEFDNNLLEDFIIIKSDGMPSYNFACVIDDSDMKITHVIRGDDHISNTPKQIALFDVLNITPPKYAHIPLILGEDRTRLSKRHGATSLDEYRKEGIIPEGLLNFLAFLGWAPVKKKEIMSKDEIVKEFSINKINNTSAVFNYDKLKWINSQQIRLLSLDDLTSRIKSYLVEKKIIDVENNCSCLSTAVKLLQNRIKNFDEFYDQAEYFLKDDFKFKQDALDILSGNPCNREYLLRFADLLKTANEFSLESTELILRNLAKDSGVEASILIHPVRAALTGRTVSPGLFDVIVALGKDRTIARLIDAAN